MTSPSSSCSINKLEIELMEAGQRLLLLRSSVQELLIVLRKIEYILCGVPQLPSQSMQYAMQPSVEALITKELLSHPDMDVNISVACCICEILRIMAPDAPYNDEQMKEFFQLAVITMEKLSAASGGCYIKITTVLKSFSNVRLSVLMLDLQLDELIVRMFQQFFNAAGSNCSVIVLEMEKIMTMIIEESEQLTFELVSLLVTSVRTDNQIALPVSWQLGENVLKNCVSQLKPYLPDIVRDMGIALCDYSEMVARICNGASENESMEAKKLASVYNSSGEINPATNDTSKPLMKDRALMRKGKNRVQTVNPCQQTTSLSARNEILNSETNGKKRKIKPNSLIHNAEGYDHSGKVFLTRSWRSHAKRALSSPHVPAMPSKTVTEVKVKRKRKYNSVTSLNKEAVEQHGENLVGSRIKVWWPMDKMYYEGVVASFDPSSKTHKVCYTDGDEEILHLKKEQWELIKDGARATPVANPPSLQADPSHQTNRYPQLVVALPIKAPPPQPDIISVHGYCVKASTAPILKAIFKKHGDIAAQCTFKTASVITSFLEVVCEVVRRIQSNDVATIFSEMESIESQVSEAEAANLEVSWLRRHLETFHKRTEAKKRSSVLMDTKANTMLVKRAAKGDLRERHAELMAAQQRYEEAERCVEALDLVEKKLKSSILESKAEQDSWTKPQIL